MKRRVWLVVAQATVTGLLLWAILRRFDWRAFGVIVDSIPAAFYGYGFGLLAIGQVLYAIRWYLVLRGMGIRLGWTHVLRFHLIGLMFNTVLPTAVGGDGARAFYVGRDQGYAEAGVSVVADRVLGLLSLVGVATALAWILGDVGWAPDDIRQLLTALFTGGAVALAVALALPLERLLPRQTGRGGRTPGWVAEACRALARSRRAVRSPAVSLGAVTLTLANLVLTALLYRGFFSVTQPATPALPELVLVLAVVAIFVNIPVSLNGIGLREQLHVWLLAGLGVSREAAVAVSLLVLIQLLSFSLIGLAVWLSVSRTQTAASVSPGASR